MFIHPDLLAVIQKAAAFDPGERYRTFEEFSEDILCFMEKNEDCLDEKVPTYLLTELRERTIPLFTESLALS